MTKTALSRKEHRFVEAYLLHNLTQWKAAEVAGYSGDRIQLWTVGCKVYNRPHVQAAIQAALSEESMPLQEVLARLTEQARNVGMRYVRPDGTVNLEQMLTDNKMHLVQSITPSAYGLHVVFLDPQWALEQLCRFHGLGKQRMEVDGNVTITVVYEGETYDVDITAAD